MTVIRCRARKSTDCYDGRECEPIYGEDSMAGDCTYDGETVVCDACYIAWLTCSSSNMREMGLE